MRPLSDYIKSAIILKLICHWNYPQKTKKETILLKSLPNYSKSKHTLLTFNHNWPKRFTPIYLFDFNTTKSEKPKSTLFFYASITPTCQI